MNRNIEIKARVHDPAHLRERVAALADHGPELIEQDDTFFHVESGRLKLRVFADGRGELIWYERPDTSRAKTSRWMAHHTGSPRSLRDTLAKAHGIRGRILKRRTLFLVGQTRVHLDEVEGLGDFLELEVVLREDQSIEEGEHIAEELMRALGVDSSELLEGAYIDLVEAQGDV